MTRKRGPKYKLASFDPRFKEMLLRGARSTFTIPFDSKSRAHRFKNRCQEYRHQYSNEKGKDDDITRELYRCKILVIEDNGSFHLQFGPHDSEFQSIFDGMGIELEDQPETLEHDPLDDIPLD